MPSRIAIAALSMLVAYPAVSGCYDSKSLVTEARNRAIRSRLEEISLGQYRTTLPRSAVDDSPMEVELDLFGTAPRRKIADIEQVIAASDYRLRQAVLVAIRQTTAAEIADPHLTTFRERLLSVVNNELAETPVETIGFRSVRFIPL